VEARKIVTVVFADVSGSTELGERLDPEALRRVMERYFAEARQALERHGGTVEKFIGDAVMAVFGIPAAHEDDALRAVKAAADMRAAIAGLNESLERDRGVTLAVRTGINTGEVVAGDPSSGDFYASGDTVNVAARLEQAAEPGEILLGEHTYRFVRDVVDVEAAKPLDLKGKGNAVAAYRLLEVIEESQAATRRFDTPFVGRASELARLLDCFERSVAARAPALLTVLGPAGIGKTRLGSELIAAVGERATVLNGRCLAYGEGITFWPLQEILRGLPDRPAGAPDPERARGTEETFWAYRKLFEALAQERPLLLMLEDIHWAEPTLLDLVEHVIEWTREAPMVIVCLARSELLDERPDWLGERVELQPLHHGEAETLVTALAFDLDAGARARALEVAEGNPLFLEHLLVLAAEDGQQLAVPQTIQALLAARLDRLQAEERTVLERAAVVGKEFWRGALVHLCPPAMEVSVLLQRLVRRRLVHPERSSFPGEDAFRFGHILIRDVSYAGISKAVRAGLHERFADWLESRGSPYDEIVGYHLEQAVRLNEQVQEPDARALVLARRAADLLSESGTRAFARGDLPASRNLFERAVALLSPESDRRLMLQSSLGRCLLELGDAAEAEAVLADTARGAAVSAQRARELEALIELALVRQFSDTTYSTAELLEFGNAAVRELEVLGEDQVLARAWGLVFQVHFTELQLGAADVALERAIEYARRASDEAALEENLRSYASSAFWGPTPVPEAMRRCEQILASSEGEFLQASVAGRLACLQAMVGKFDAARDLVTKSIAVFLDRGHLVARAGNSELYAYVETLAGEHEAAARELREGYDTLERLGEKRVLSTIAGYLANSLYALGQDKEAQTLSARVEETAAADDVTSQVLWRRVRAKLAARRRAFDEGETLAGEAVALLEHSDAPDYEADAWRDLAHVRELAGRLDLAAEAAQRAVDLYEQKGNLVSARAARQMLHDLGAGRRRKHP
jgi:class 3 adenylate cyclase/tetratricopeptide (TPR) repeat protein